MLNKICISFNFYVETTGANTFNTLSLNRRFCINKIKQLNIGSQFDLFFNFSDIFFTYYTDTHTL